MLWYKFLVSHITSPPRLLILILNSLTHSTVQSPSWAADWFAASQEIPPPFHGTRRFITALTSVRQLSLSWASPIQSIYTHHTSWRSILILSTHLRLGLPSGSFPPVSPPRPYTPPLLTHTCHMPSPFTYTTTNHDFTLTLSSPTLQNETTNVVINIIVASSWWWVQ